MYAIGNLAFESLIEWAITFYPELIEEYKRTFNEKGRETIFGEMFKKRIAKEPTCIYLIPLPQLVPLGFDVDTNYEPDSREKPLINSISGELAGIIKAKK